MALPLFDEPPPRRMTTQDPTYFAFWTGFRQGASGASRLFRYDGDETIDRYYQDGWRIGRLFYLTPEQRDALRDAKRRRFR